MYIYFLHKTFIFSSNIDEVLHANFQLFANKHETLDILMERRFNFKFIGRLNIRCEKVTYIM